MLRSLVGSEMCIRDRGTAQGPDVLVLGAQELSHIGRALLEIWHEGAQLIRESHVRPELFDVLWCREVPDCLEFGGVRPDAPAADDMTGEFDLFADLKLLAGDRDVMALAPFQHDVDAGPHFVGRRGPYDDIVHYLHAPVLALDRHVRVAAPFVG